MKPKKIIALLLALLTLILPLAACNADKEPETDTKAPASDTEEVTGEVDYLDTVRGDAYGFKELKILAHNVTPETFEDAQKQGLEFEAVWERDEVLMEKYGVEISYTYLDINSSIAMTQIRNDALTGASEYEFINSTPETLALVVLEGSLAEMTNIENLNFDGEWWNQNFNNQMKIHNKLYFAGGSWSRLYYHLPTAVAFNKTIIDDLGIGSANLYQKVIDHEWTLEEMKKICVDYDITDAENQKYMLCPAMDNMYMTFGCVGGMFSTFDSDGNIVVDLANDYALNRIDSLIELFDPARTDFQKIFDTIPVFTEGRAAFTVTTVGVMYEYRKYEVDYGIIPFPKYDENQKDYISTAACNSNFAVAIPESLEGNEQAYAGLMLEVMTYLGLEIIKPVKYDNVLAFKVAQDESTSEIVLDIIFGNMYFDTNLAFNFGGSRDLIGTTINSGTSNKYMSTMKFNANVIKKAIEIFNK